MTDPPLRAGGPVRTLAGGVGIPVLGLGVWQMAAGRETEQAVEWALEVGYRHVDTASIYRNEQSVGAALARVGLPREDVFVTTKWAPMHRGVASELARSLERLGLEYVDLYLVHWPVPVVAARGERELEKLRERGLARAVGVSNYGTGRLSRLVADGRAPAVNQVLFNPFNFRRRLLDCCDRNGIVLEAYSPLARGRALDDPTVAEIARRLGRTPAQVLLRWSVQHGAVVIPKSSQRDRIRSNAQIFDFTLAEEEMRALDGLDRTGGTGRAR